MVKRDLGNGGRRQHTDRLGFAYRVLKTGGR